MRTCAHPAPRRLGSLVLSAFCLALLGMASPASAQVLIKVNDNINFKLGILLQAQADWQEVANAANTGSGGFAQNMMVRRARFILGGQVAPNVFFYVDTENANLGKSTQTTTSGTTGVKAPATGFNLLDAVGEWRIAKELNIQAGEILVPTNRWILTSSASTFMLDQSAYNNLYSTGLQNNTGRDTGFMYRGFFFCDRLEYRSAVLSGYREPGVKNSPRFTQWAQWNFFDTEVYALPSYAGANFGNKKILALGGGYDAQADYKMASANLFMDFPIDLGSFESTVVYQYINGGTLIPTLPQENTFSIEGGLYVKNAHIAPILRYEQKTFTATPNTTKNESRYATGFNIYPYPKATNNFNIKVWWQYVAPKVGVGTNEFTVQMQAFYF